MTKRKTKILIMGVTGMLGHNLFRYFNLLEDFEVLGTLRNSAAYDNFPEEQSKNLFYIENVNQELLLNKLVDNYMPDVLINCIGLVKQILDVNDPINTIQINSLLPHRLYQICNQRDIRLIHISTDCVFSGTKGDYKEIDVPDALDLYGRSKMLGEQNNHNSLTIRTSIIGHELSNSHSLLEWFLNQKNEVYGYKNAIFSGFPTIEISKIIEKIIIPNKNLSGIYHISSQPISKYKLLKLIAEIYEKKIKIIPDTSVNINRSLNSDKFSTETGFYPEDWINLIKNMHNFG